MRNITKVFLLVVVAFVVYLLWPRKPDIKTFVPAEIAALEVQTWQAEKAGKGLGALVARYKIYTSQYHFAPISAYRIAAGQGAALEYLKPSHDTSSGTADSAMSAMLSALTEKYTWIKQQTNGTFDPDVMAHEEFSWRSLELDEDGAQAAAASLSRVLAGLYGGSSADFTEVATNLVYARSLIFKDGTATSDGSSPVSTAQTTAREAYTSLKEIASTPITAPAAAQ